MCAVAAIAGGLTLFSGFGLGTVLMPVFAVFFPVTVAVAATAVVHLANNVFKLFLVGRYADASVVKRFAIPAAAAAIVGAFALSSLAGVRPLFHYSIGSHDFSITVVKVVIGLLIIVFALFEFIPRLSEISFSRKYLAAGGLLSGFFGGLSGNQGALRGAYLIKAGLSKEGYIGTSNVSAVIVDAARMIVYGFSFMGPNIGQAGDVWRLAAAAAAASFGGSFFGARLINTITVNTIRNLVAIMLVLIGILMTAGLI